MGILVLMGSGELTATMVEIHKMLLARFGAKSCAVFLDTPAGFQLNADQISANAVEYFRKRVGSDMAVASYKSHTSTTEIDAALAFQRLRQADYIMMGPGSPTYTVNQLLPSPIPKIFIDHVLKGGCLVAASAAALTMGRFTLPVYEIYKVGAGLHWVEGLDTLGSLGLDLVVIPHWNNAEGGTHDTSRCFMGKSRYEKLLTKLPDALPILGLDEHTACIIDLAADTFDIHGIGSATFIYNDETRVFSAGKTYPLGALRGSIEMDLKDTIEPVRKKVPEPTTDAAAQFWEHVHALANDFQQSIETDNVKGSANALLDLDRVLWKAHADLENPDIIAQARDLFREELAILGTRPYLSLSSLTKTFGPVVEQLLALRQRFRDEHNYAAGDAIREALAKSNIIVEDTPDGSRWSMLEKTENPTEDQTKR
jgi:cyanophycinase-like exopeptidase